MKKSTIINIRSLLVTDASKPLRGKELDKAQWIHDAWLSTEEGIISDFGSMKEFSPSGDESITDADGRLVLPCWCDSHTHLIFAAWREQEFEDRIHGLTYEEIAQRGGGILNSAERLRKATEGELYESAALRLNEMIRLGTGAVEIKSGYGLTLESELKMLRIIRKIKETFPIPVKATFLGAHAVPAEFKNNKPGYLKLIKEQMIPAVAAEGLADFCDVFCERGYFTKDETLEILIHAADYGMVPKVHANQLSHSGGIEAGTSCNAISVDHLEFTSDRDLQLLAESETIATLLPAAAFFLNLQMPAARKLIEHNAVIAAATDFNPGSSPTGNMNLVVSMLCVKAGMTPSEAIHAATLNGAFAMNVQTDCGSLAKGKRANFILTQPMESAAFIPYSLGRNPAGSVFINGQPY
ncbi:MAG: imidazolonepropionase [Bacteroidia bacterium]|nr:imidazolonepropionase [Bacteroidia bacterium]MCZ2276332.1 imidazolonepropionase [Bacteroidia bacterium]